MGNTVIEEGLEKLIKLANDFLWPASIFYDINPKSRLSDDLEMDDLDETEFGYHLESSFDIKILDDEPEKLHNKSMEEIWEFIKTKM